jgi:hypothetical protein
VFIYLDNFRRDPNKSMLNAAFNSVTGDQHNNIQIFMDNPSSAYIENMDEEANNIMLNISMPLIFCFTC